MRSTIPLPPCKWTTRRTRARQRPSPQTISLACCNRCTTIALRLQEKPHSCRPERLQEQKHRKYRRVVRPYREVSDEVVEYYAADRSRGARQPIDRRYFLLRKRISGKGMQISGPHAHAERSNSELRQDDPCVRR